MGVGGGFGRGSSRGQGNRRRPAGDGEGQEVAGSPALCARPSLAAPLCLALPRRCTVGAGTSYNPY